MMQNLQREAWYLGNLAGVPIFLHWSAALLALLVLAGAGSGGGAEWVVMILIALITGILLHELGHGLMARALGAHGITITLWAFGGLCSSRRDSSRLGREIAIVAAGPAVSLALWLGAVATYGWMRVNMPEALTGPHGHSLVALALIAAILVNKALFIFNMMPIFPMDGGQLVYYSALATTRNQLLARQLSLTLAVVGAFAFFAWRTSLIAILQDGGTVGVWVAQLDLGDVFLALLLAWVLRSAFTYLY